MRTVPGRRVESCLSIVATDFAVFAFGSEALKFGIELGSEDKYRTLRSLRRRISNAFRNEDGPSY